MKEIKNSNDKNFLKKVFIKLCRIFGYEIIDQNNFSKIEKILKDNNIYFDTIGVTQKEYFELDKDLKISVKELYDLNNRWYNKYNGFIS